MTIISRLQLDHPALGAAGGAGLHSSIEAIYSKIGDYMNSRFFIQNALANAASQDFEHNFKCAFDELRYILYLRDTGTGELTRIDTASTPPISQFTLVATPSFLTTKIRVTNSSGSPRDIALVVVQGKGAEVLDDLEDVDLATAPQDGQALVYSGSGSKWIPGASGDASFKIQEVTDPNAVIKGGYLLIDDERELATYDGAGGASTDYGTDLTVNLDTILGSNPANATAYYLYIDLYTLGAVVTLSDNGRKVYGVTQSNLVLSTTTPESRDPRQYVPLGFIRSATTGTVWSGTGAAFGTLAFRRHETLTRFFSNAETFVDESITTAVATTTLNHNLSGEPHALYLTYDDNTTEIGLDLSAHLLDVSATQIKVASLGLTFGGGQKLRVRAIRFPTQATVATASRQFVSTWFQSTATTTLPHGLNDIDDIKAYTVQEWDTTAGRYRLMDHTALVINYDATNFYLDWTGLVPSATLRYRVVAGGSPLPVAVPLQYGGFTRFVGFGSGSYATLTAAIAAAAAGDSILVGRDTAEPAGDLNINKSGIRIQFMPGVKMAMSGVMTNGLRITAAKVRLEGLLLELNPSGIQARGISVEAVDAWIDGKIEKIGAQTLTDGVHVTAGGTRVYGKIAIETVAGTVTNKLTNSLGAGLYEINVWG